MGEGSFGAARPGLTTSSALAVAAVGGGHGLSASLRAIRRYASTITAVVSVADDGGSSGVLRDALPDLPAPGDVRKCLGALADDTGAFARILEHRYGDGDLEGHTLGNLVLVALALEMGSFADAVDEVAQRVGAVGRVLPATVGPVQLEGRYRGVGAGAVETEGTAVGQVAVQNSSGLFEIRLRPADPVSRPEVSAAITDADQVIVGPGSLFTSVLAAAVVPAVRSAIERTTAQRVFVANLGPQVPETQGFTVADELGALDRHGIPVDVVVVDERRGDAGSVGQLPSTIEVVWAAVADETGAAHDPQRLAGVLARLAGTAAASSANAT